MGSSESTSRSNQTEDEEERKPEGDSSGGPSAGGVGTAIAVAAGAAAVAYGISRMLSAGKDEENQENDDRMKIKAPGTVEPYYRQNSLKNGPGAGWSPPRFGVYKMNTDGGARPDRGPSGYGEILPDHNGKLIRGPSGYGGILRDHNGKWIRGFRGFIGDSENFTAEFHGILKGLELLDKLGLRKSVLESDCEAAMIWMENGDDPKFSRSEIVKSCSGIITKCRRLVQENEIEIIHVLRGSNKCADKLADMAIDKKEDYMEIKELPYELEDLVKADSVRK